MRITIKPRVGARADVPLVDGCRAIGFELDALHTKVRASNALRVTRKKMIRARNADPILDAVRTSLQDEGDRIHVTTPGTFVMGSMIPGLLDVLGGSLQTELATLSMSYENAETIRGCIDRGQTGPVRMILSHYFCVAEKLFPKIRAVLHEVPICIVRSHAKVFLFRTATRCIVIESSANLRSSDCIEQMTIFQDRELWEHYQGWMNTLTYATAADGADTRARAKSTIEFDE